MMRSPENRPNLLRPRSAQIPPHTRQPPVLVALLCLDLGQARTSLGPVEGSGFRGKRFLFHLEFP